MVKRFKISDRVKWQVDFLHVFISFCLKTHIKNCNGSMERTLLLSSVAIAILTEKSR